MELIRSLDWKSADVSELGIRLPCSVPHDMTRVNFVYTGHALGDSIVSLACVLWTLTTSGNPLHQRGEDPTGGQSSGHGRVETKSANTGVVVGA
jgi:hypothetical protein